MKIIGAGKHKYLFSSKLRFIAVTCKDEGFSCFWQTLLGDIDDNLLTRRGVGNRRNILQTMSLRRKKIKKRHGRTDKFYEAGRLDTARKWLSADLERDL